MAAEKRELEGSTGVPAKRRQTRPDACVAAILRDTQQYHSEVPALAREMLAAGAEHALAGGDRGDVGDKVVALCREVLADTLDRAREAASVAAEETEAAEAVLADAAKDIEAAAAALVEAREGLPGALENLRAKEAAVGDEEAVLAADREAGAGLAREVEVVEGRRQGLRDFLADCFEPLLEGAGQEGAGEEERGQGLSADKADVGDTRRRMWCQVKAFLTSIDADEALVAGARTALTRSPDARGPFDLVVVKELQAALGDYAEVLDRELGAFAGPRDDAEATVMGAEAVLHVARKRVADAAAGVSAAEAAVARTEADLAQAEAAAKTHRAATSGALIRQTLEEERVRAVEGALEAIQEAAEAAASPQAEEAAAPEAVEAQSPEVLPKLPVEEEAQAREVLLKAHVESRETLVKQPREAFLQSVSRMGA